MSLRALIQKLAEAVGQDDDLIALANKVFDLYLFIEDISEDNEGARAIFYDWEAAEKFIHEAEAHSKHATPLIPLLKQLGKDAKSLQGYIDRVIKAANAIDVSDVDYGDLEDDDYEYEDDYGHKRRVDDSTALRDKQERFKEGGQELVDSFSGMAEDFEKLKKKKGDRMSFDDIVTVSWDDIKRDDALQFISGDYEEAAGLGDAWQDEVKLLRKHAAEAVPTIRKVVDDLPEV